MGVRSSLTVEERIRARVPTNLGPDVCWPWQGTMNRYNGYGQFSYRDDGKVVCRRAHRAVYEIFVGPIPDGLTIDHLCMNKTCVNPAHLEPVTPVENTRRAIAVLGTDHLGRHQRDKTHCPHGHPYDDANTYVTPEGRRHCRACTRLRALAWAKVNRARVNANKRRLYHAKKAA